MKRLLLNKKVALEKGIYKKFPEKVLQFGTGALLRGLPDFFIHKASLLLILSIWTKAGLLASICGKLII